MAGREQYRLHTSGDSVGSAIEKSRLIYRGDRYRIWVDGATRAFDRWFLSVRDVCDEYVKQLRSELLGDPRQPSASGDLLADVMGGWRQLRHGLEQEGRAALSSYFAESREISEEFGDALETLYRNRFDEVECGFLGRAAIIVGEVDFRNLSAH